MGWSVSKIGRGREMGGDVWCVLFRVMRHLEGATCGLMVWEWSLLVGYNM